MGNGIMRTEIRRISATEGVRIERRGAFVSIDDAGTDQISPNSMAGGTFCRASYWHIVHSVLSYITTQQSTQIILHIKQVRLHSIHPF